MVCDALAYEKAVEETADAEDAALYKEGMRIWDKALAEVQAQDIARAEAEWAKHLAQANPWEALRARERTVKDRELSRRENRQNAYDTADASTGELANVEPDWDTFNAMTMDVVRSTTGNPPSILSRNDGRTILYAQKVNTVAARPNGGKSWLAIKCAIEVVERRGACRVANAGLRQQTAECLGRAGSGHGRGRDNPEQRVLPIQGRGDGEAPRRHGCCCSMAAGS